MTRIDRITRVGRGPESVLRAQRLLAVERVGPRPDRDTGEDAEPDDARRRAPRRKPAGGSPDDQHHIDVQA